MKTSAIKLLVLVFVVVGCSDSAVAPNGGAPSQQTGPLTVNADGTIDIIYIGGQWGVKVTSKYAGFIFTPSSFRISGITATGYSSAGGSAIEHDAFPLTGWVGYNNQGDSRYYFIAPNVSALTCASKLYALDDFIVVNGQIVLNGSLTPPIGKDHPVRFLVTIHGALSTKTGYQCVVFSPKKTALISAA